MDAWELQKLAAENAGLTTEEHDKLMNLATDVWKEVLSSGYTAEQLLDLIACVNAAKLSGADTATINIRDLADTKNRVVATVDNDGNRTSVTLDVS